jgi:RNA polymerase II-associated factor 1
MDLKSYPKGEEARGSSSKVLSLHPDDDALLIWKGSMGDTAADNLKKRQERARAATRAALGSKSIAAAISSVSQYTQRPNKKAFSRVLDEGMQSWMKKTTYLSNDYSRKVHDFKSLAQTKQELAIDLATKQEELSKHRSVYAVNQSFDFDKCPLQHPTKKNMQPKSILPLLPNVSHYGRAYTHVVIDKAPVLEKRFKMQDLDAAFIAHVEKKEANARMTCQLLVPTTHNVIDDEDEALAEDDTSSVNYQAAQAFNLDVVPLKEDESPHVNFCFWIDERTSEATYLPISSRVQLSSSRPIEDGGIRRISRRELTITEQEEIEEGMAEVDADMAEKHHVSFNRPLYRSSTTIRANTDGGKGPARSYAHEGDDDDDQEEDFGDDNDDSSDSGDEVLFGAAQKTIIAER